MKHIPSNVLLDQLQTETEAVLEHIVRNWQLISPDKLSRTPSAGAWSAQACLSHLNSYGDFYLPAIQRAIRKSGNGPSTGFHPGWLGNYFTQMMRTDAKGSPVTKMKAIKKHFPSDAESPDAVIATFIDQQEKLHALLGSARSISLDTRVPVSIAPLIRLKLGDVFRFLIAHNYRHLHQAGRALLAAGISLPALPKNTV
jgi:hypothetical protein